MKPKATGVSEEFRLDIGSTRSQPPQSLTCINDIAEHDPNHGPHALLLQGDDSSVEPI